MVANCVAFSNLIPMQIIHLSQLLTPAACCHQSLQLLCEFGNLLLDFHFQHIGGRICLFSADFHRKRLLFKRPSTGTLSIVILWKNAFVGGNNQALVQAESGKILWIIGGCHDRVISDFPPVMNFVFPSIRKMATVSSVFVFTTCVTCWNLFGENLFNILWYSASVVAPIICTFREPASF